MVDFRRDKVLHIQGIDVEAVASYKYFRTEVLKNTLDWTHNTNAEAPLCELEISSQHGTEESKGAGRQEKTLPSFLGESSEQTEVPTKWHKQKKTQEYSINFTY